MPYLAIEAVGMLARITSCPTPRADSPAPLEKLVDNYFHAVEHGMLKVFAKMGISTLASYKGRRF